MDEPEKAPPTVAEVAREGRQRARAVRDVATLFLGGTQPMHLKAAAGWIDRTVETLEQPVCAAEIVARGLDDRLGEIITSLIGDTLSAETVGRLALTREEQWALGYGPVCPCGEMGMQPGEEVIETDDGETCSLCARLAAEDAKT